MSAFGIRKQGVPGEPSPPTTLDEFLETLKHSSDLIKRPSFYDYLVYAQPMFPCRSHSIIDLIGDFERARQHMGPSIGAQERFDDQVRKNLSKWKGLLKDDPSSSAGKLERDYGILNCIRRTVAIIYALPVEPSTIEMVIRFARHAGTIHGNNRIPLIIGFRVADMVADRRAIPGLTPSELGEWATYIIAASLNLENADFEVLEKIERKIANLKLSGFNK